MKKLFLSIVILASSTLASAIPFPLRPGTYGNQTQFCGFKLYSSPRKGQIIIQYLSNPGRPQVFCTWNGVTETWKYDKTYNAFRIDREDKFCLLSPATDYSVQMTCYYSSNSDLQSVDTYEQY